MALTLDQAIAFGTLLITFALFLWGRFRYDVVAMLALLAVVLTDLVPFDQAFSDFAHPAVITVAAALSDKSERPCAVFAARINSST